MRFKNKKLLTGTMYKVNAYRAGNSPNMGDLPDGSGHYFRYGKGMENAMLTDDKGDDLGSNQYGLEFIGPERLIVVSRTVQ